MTTQTSPKPVATQLEQPLAAPLQDRPTAPLEPSVVEHVLDALPLLDHRTRRRTIPVGLAPRGHYLALQHGDETRLLRLHERITHIGRGSGCEVRIDEHRVSRTHAIFVRHGRHFRVLDNRSSNGTFVNGRRIVATNVENGDVIVLGAVVVQYVSID